MNNVINNQIINIENMIYEIRGVQVMFSKDVDKLYQVETKRIKITGRIRLGAKPTSCTK